ncbi:hypothetical protein [Mycolicibacterium sphagni]|uniref:Secreted protein n=1 Tax=Mycolicibacterium sphagni TaxID=1786 RepID=A0ABX2JT86_9MYCO|nr:hypothetical protein [Mycolicibacterium sphagni]NTY60908.1 hypothetical protein [Mycolicibacterium sphagni]
MTKLLVPAASAALLMGSFAVTSAAPGVSCPPENQSQIDILDGPITCGDAYATAGQYQAEGEKYQQVGPFTCYTGNAMTLPVVLSCTSDSAEFAVNNIAPPQ